MSSNPVFSAIQQMDTQSLHRIVDEGPENHPMLEAIYFAAIQELAHRRREARNIGKDQSDATNK